MKKTLIASVAILALAVGCSNKKNETAAAPQDSLTSITPPPPSNTNALPMNSGMPVTPVDPAPVDGRGVAGAPVAGQKYVVKQGDTLWNIALRAYGDGTQFKKIAQANASIKGNAIKAGQTITLP